MKKAFTLLETLIVIAILAIIAAFLFPVFAESKASAKNTQDLSNQKQLGMALVLYTNDNDNMFVPIGSWNDPSITPFTNPQGPPGLQWNSWALKLSRYSSRGVFVSPFMPKVANWWTEACETSNGMPITSTYAYNWFLGADNSYIGLPWEYYNVSPSGLRIENPFTENAIESTSSTIAFQLSQTTSAYGNAFGCLYNSIENADWDNKIRFRAVHRNGGNISFADGHSKFYLAKEADSNACNGAPCYEIYSWESRNLWAWPGMPSNDAGFPKEPIKL